MIRRGGGLLLLATVSTLVAPRPSAAQGPPDPLEARPWRAPEVTLDRARPGFRTLVVASDEVPLVTVDLILPGGQSTDPDGLEGLSLLAASLLKSGTATRGWAEVTEALDRLGVALNATADADWTRISLVALPEVLDEALRIMAEVVVTPTFPEGRIETVRDLALGALATQRSQPAALARRVMLREVYRGHPYGKQTTEATIRAIGREDLLAHHARWYRPGSALFVVAGDVEPARVAARLERAFAGWRGGAAEPAELAPVGRTDGGVVLVHQPGAVQAEIRIGHPLPAGPADGWTALEAGVHHLGATPSGRLVREIREQLGFTYAAEATAERRVEAGVLEVAFAARTEVAAEGLGEALRIVDDVVTRPMSESDRRAAVDFLAGSFPLRNETPQQVATRLSSRALLGLAPEDPETLLSRLRGLTAGEIRRALAEAVDVGRAEIVVVGDATVLQPQLALYGDVRVELPDGSPVSMTELLPAERSVPLSAEGLEAGLWRYAVTLQGQPVGSLVREVGRSGDEARATSTLVLGPRTTTQTVTFGVQEFDFLGSEIEIVQPGARVVGEVRGERDRIVGFIDVGQGREEVDLAVPPGVLVSDMLELAVWISELEVGDEFTLPLATVSTESISNTEVRVVERTQITVPAGTFEVFRVEVEGADPQTIWARVEAPHVAVRVVPGDQPIVLELAEVGAGPAGRP